MRVGQTTEQLVTVFQKEWYIYEEAESGGEGSTWRDQ